MLSPKDIRNGPDVRISLQRGVNVVRDAVSTTLGPRGRNVLIVKSGTPHITKDGVTVAREIVLEDPYENAGAQLLKDVASKSGEEAGDGTTTATVIAAEIYNLGLKQDSVDLIQLQRGIEAAADVYLKHLETTSAPAITLEDLLRVATVSANWDSEIGDLVAEAVHTAQLQGSITVEESKTTESSVNVLKGYSFKRGLMSPYFITDQEKQTADYERAAIVLIDRRIERFKDILPVIERVFEKGAQHPGGLIIIAEGFGDEVISSIVLNRVNNSIPINLIQAPAFANRKKDAMLDLAVVTGATLIGEESEVATHNIQLRHIGHADRIITSRTETVIVGDNDPEIVEPLEEHVKGLIKRLEEQKGDKSSEEDHLKKRIAKLTNGVVTIQVGANTEANLMEKKDRVDDAVAATVAALEEGVVMGGGAALINLIHIAAEEIDALPEEHSEGANILTEAIKAPFMTILRNAGIPEDEIATLAAEVAKTKKGYNVITRRCEDLLESGVIDPAKVTRCALQYAASAASLLLTTECVISDKPIPSFADLMQGGGAAH